MLGNLFRSLLWVVAQSLCFSQTHSEDYCPNLGWASVGCRKWRAFGEWAMLLGWKVLDIRLANESKGKRLIFPGPISQISSSLKLWFPGSCWRGSEFLRWNSAQYWFCPQMTGDCVLLAVPRHPFPSLPHSFLPKGSGAQVPEEWPSKLSVWSKCTVGYFPKVDLSNPFLWR